jgi:hypothetical protein
MRERSTRTYAALLAVTSALAFAGGPALADDGDGPVAPDPGVARISVVQGEVDVHRADADETYAAVVNAPVSAGDYLSTSDGSRGEVEFDYGTALRLAPDTQLRFTDLEPKRHALQLALGTVEVRVFRGLAAHADVETPAASIRPSADGSYRISVTDSGETLVTVRSGRVDVVTSGGTQALEPGPTLSIAGSADAPNVQPLEPVAFDAFDAFNRSRDVAVERADDWAYVDAGFVGADDLDAYGSWSDVDGYGHVWQPTYEPAGWSPYSTGRWVWEPYYGWSWIDDAPWGYAPYHYGRWFYANDGWYWSPGLTVAGRLRYSSPVAFYERPVSYRPALVAFFSFGGGGGLSIGFGNIGWCALAPSEPFHPWYGRGYDRTTVVNVTNVTNVYSNVDVTRTYRNLSVPGGAVAVNNGSFANGNFSHIVTLRRSELATVTPVRGVVPVVPTASNLTFGSHRILSNATASSASPRFSRFTTQPRTPVVSFAQQQRLVQTAAVKNYPEHETVLAHPDLVRQYDRPGLITTENAPEPFKATTRGPGTYGRTAVPIGTTTATTPPTTANGSDRKTQPTNDPYARFNRGGTATTPPTAGTYGSGSHVTPQDRTSGETAAPIPAYRSVPTYRPVPTSTAPGYAAPNDAHTPSPYPRPLATPRPYLAHPKPHPKPTKSS